MPRWPGDADFAGYAVDPNGEMEPLAGASLEIGGDRTWNSEAGAHFPVDWRIRAGELQLNVASVADEQLHDFAAPLWSGIVTVKGVPAIGPFRARHAAGDRDAIR